jgi:GntR family transcriptional regulator, transcriptional repressor for pyruvate dehydrogenase complex
MPNDFLPAAIVPIEPPVKVAELVARQVRARIASGTLHAGDRLPSEAEMIEAFSVSRGSLREALRMLEGEGLIRVTRGNRKGPVVTNPDIGRLSEYASVCLALRGGTVGDIHAARTMLEPAIVRSIAESPNAANTAQVLADCAAVLASASANGDLTAAGAALENFHRQLFIHLENVALELVMLMLGGLQDEGMVVSMIGGNERNAATLDAKLREIADDYQKLCVLIRQGDADKAERFWRDYMQASARFLEQTGMAANPVRYSPT